MLTREDKVRLGRLTERDGAGHHFTDVEDTYWLRRMEDAGYITITRPVHEQTGMPYGRGHWHLDVAPVVESWFGPDGELDPKAEELEALIVEASEALDPDHQGEHWPDPIAWDGRHLTEQARDLIAHLQTLCEEYAHSEDVSVARLEHLEDLQRRMEAVLSTIP